MDFPALALLLNKEDVQSCNIAPTITGFNVSILRRGGTGWEVYYGSELDETLERAVTHGPQSPRKPSSTVADDIEDLI